MSDCSEISAYKVMECPKVPFKPTFKIIIIGEPLTGKTLSLIMDHFKDESGTILIHQPDPEVFKIFEENRKRETETMFPIEPFNYKLEAYILPEYLNKFDFPPLFRFKVKQVRRPVNPRKFFRRFDRRGRKPYRKVML